LRQSRYEISLSAHQAAQPQGIRVDRDLGHACDFPCPPNVDFDAAMPPQHGGKPPAYRQTLLSYFAAMPPRRSLDSSLNRLPERQSLSAMCGGKAAVCDGLCRQSFFTDANA
jgi:hypothetical protein